MEAKVLTGRSYSFDRFVLDLDRMALLENGQPVELRPKAFDTLLALAERANRVVTKDELVAIVWPNVIVNDDALAQCVRDIRKAIGDSKQEILRTVPRRGYMLAAAVEQRDAVPQPQRAAGKRGPLRALFFVIAALAGLVLAVVASNWMESGSSDATAAFARAPQVTVAVLPFDAGGEASETAWLSEGLADELIESMSLFRDVAVIARNSSFGYRDADLATIRDVLGADFLVQGSVRRVGEKLRLAVQMVDLSTGVNHWANRFERPYADLPAVLEEVSSELTSALAAKARDAVVTRAAGRGTAVLNAYELALKARKALTTFSKESTFEALELVEQALEADPEYAVAWDLLAQVYIQLFIQPYDGRRGDPATLAQARDAASKAVSLDPSYSTARATLAGLISRQGDYDEALDMLRRALELNPNDATALAAYADILSRAGDHRASLAAWQAHKRIDPVGTTLGLALLARAQMFTGDTEGALATARTCETRAPRFQPCLVFLAISAAAAGEEALARQAGERLLEVNPRFTISEHFRIVPFRNADDVEVMRRHLRTAGVPD